MPLLQKGSDGSGASWEQMKTNFPDLEVGKWPLNPSTKKKCCKKVHRLVYLPSEIEVVDSGSSDCVHEHFADLLLVKSCSLPLWVNYFQFCFSSLKEICTNKYTNPKFFPCQTTSQTFYIGIDVVPYQIFLKWFQFEKSNTPEKRKKTMKKKLPSM